MVIQITWIAESCRHSEYSLYIYIHLYNGSGAGQPTLCNTLVIVFAYGSQMASKWRMICLSMIICIARAIHLKSTTTTTTTACNATINVTNHFDLCWSFVFIYRLCHFSFQVPVGDLNLIYCIILFVCVWSQWWRSWIWSCISSCDAHMLHVPANYDSGLKNYWL